MCDFKLKTNISLNGRVSANSGFSAAFKLNEVGGAQSLLHSVASWAFLNKNLNVAIIAIFSVLHI